MLKISIKKTIFASITALAGLTSLAAAPVNAQTITGVGATFPAPLYQKWFQVYGGRTGVHFNYQPLGSGAGIKAITTHQADFGASDAPLSATQLRAAPGILHIPTVAGAVVLSYNIPGIGAGIHLTGPVIADIFLGKIKNWDDPAIVRLSPGTHFPHLGITTVHRADSSGTTNIFTTYLAEVNRDWREQVGFGTHVSGWRGLGGKGNAGVARQMLATEGSIGYLELAYAVENNIAYAAISNSHGKFIYPSVESTTIAAEGSTLPADFRKVIVNTNSVNGYPITGFTFLLVYPNTRPEVKAFLKWALSDGQSEAAGLMYAPLPSNIRARALRVVETLR